MSVFLKTSVGSFDMQKGNLLKTGLEQPELSGLLDEF